MYFFFFSSRRRHTRCSRDWSSDVCSSDLLSSTADIGVHLSLRGFDEALRFGAGGFDEAPLLLPGFLERLLANGDRKSTRLNSSHGYISYAVFCLKKKKMNRKKLRRTVTLS